MKARRTLGLVAAAMVALAMFGARSARADAGIAVADAIVASACDRMSAISDAHWHKGEYNHIIRLCRVVVSGEPDAITAYSDAAWLLWSLGRDSEAVQLYEDGLKANPGTYQFYHEIGYYYFNHVKDYRKALGYLQQAVTKPDCPVFVLHLLAHSYERIGDGALAIATWQKAADDPRNPARPTALRNLERIKANGPTLAKPGK